MSHQILVNYDEVYSKVAELRNRIQTELMEMNATYRQAASTLNGMDGSTNAAMTEAMVSNQKKTQVTADTLIKLLSFIDASTRQIERGEQSIARTFESTRTRAGRTGGTH